MELAGFPVAYALPKLELGGNQSTLNLSLIAQRHEAAWGSPPPGASWD